MSKVTVLFSFSIIFKRETMPGATRGRGRSRRNLINHNIDISGSIGNFYFEYNLNLSTTRNFILFFCRRKS